MSRHGESIQRIIQAYSQGPALVAALETYCKTLEDRAFTEAGKKTAEEVCEGLHAGPAMGLKCLSCYNAEHHIQQEMVVEAEIEQMRASKED